MFVSVPLPAQPSNLRPTQRLITSITLSWSQPLSGGRVDSYTVEYRATVRGYGIQSRGGPTSTGTQTTFTINGLQEDSDVTVTVTASNIRGSSLKTIQTSTTTTGMFLLLY